MQTFRLWIYIFAAFLVTLLVLEACLALLPVGGKGVYGADGGRDWPVHHLMPRQRYTHSSAWNLLNVHYGTTNNMGYVAPFDYAEGSRGIVVLGDSFVESLMNAYSDTLQGILPSELARPQEVLNFGTSAMSLADYLGIGAVIAAHFTPTWIVVLITKGDFTEGFSADDGYFSWDSGNTPPVRLIPVRNKSKLVKILRQSALVRYVRYNLRISLSRLVAATRPESGRANIKQCKPVQLRDQDRDLLTRYVASMSNTFRVAPQHIVLVFDSDRAAIYANPRDLPAGCASRDSNALQLFEQLAQATGVHTIDTDPIFRDYYLKTGLRVDRSPYDLHWNGIAHGLVARRVAEVINADPSPLRSQQKPGLSPP